MMERIQHQLMNWYDQRRYLEINTVGLLVTPVAQCLQALAANRSSRYRFLESNDSCFKVKSGVTMTDYLVNLVTRSCSCYTWQVTGIPCGHALAILMKLQRNPQTYTQSFFTLQFYHSTYKNAIFHPLSRNYHSSLSDAQAINSEKDEDVAEVNESNEDFLQPPSTRRPPGRLQKRWIRGTLE